MKQVLAAVMIAAAFSGCSPRTDKADTPLAVPVSQMEAAAVTQQQTRFRVERVAIFQDGLAYNDRRGVYIITDTKTGAEFLGVSGVGISELGRHQSGKVQVSDER